MQGQQKTPEQSGHPTSWVAKNQKTLIWAGVVLLIVAADLAVHVWAQRPTHISQHAQSHRSYSLNLVGGTIYKSDESSELRFDIRDENNHALKNFDTVHEKQMHLIVVRKDRAYFQHVHPTFDAASGKFAAASFTFPTDGEYRLFADFTPISSQMGPNGMKLPVTSYKDVKVGSGTYSAQPVTSDKLKSETDGFTTEATTTSVLYAKNATTLAIDIKKDGQPYKNFEEYLGALGHMVVLGPNLEYVHAHALTEATSNQTGSIQFKVTFPEPGTYKAYLQTQAAGKVSTFDYNLTAKAISGTSTPYDQPAEDMNMEHMGH